MEVKMAIEIVRSLLHLWIGTIAIFPVGILGFYLLVKLMYWIDGA
jgi:hypothetical protein